MFWRNKMTNKEQIADLKKYIDKYTETATGRIHADTGRVIKTMTTVRLAKDLYFAGYRDCAAYIKEVDRLKLELEAEKYRVEQLQKELADKDLLIEQLQDNYNTSFERIMLQQKEIDMLRGIIR